MTFWQVMWWTQSSVHRHTNSSWYQWLQTNQWPLKYWVNAGRVQLSLLHYSEERRDEKSQSPNSSSGSKTILLSSKTISCEVYTRNKSFSYFSLSTFESQNPCLSELLCVSSEMIALRQRNSEVLLTLAHGIDDTPNSKGQIKGLWSLKWRSIKEGGDTSSMWLNFTDYQKYKKTNDESNLISYH